MNSPFNLTEEANACIIIGKIFRWLPMKTYVLKSPEIKRNWYIIDADGKPLGRVAAKTAQILMGKNKPTYTAHLDDGDFVVIINAGKVALTGRKSKTKVYYHYSGFVGGMRDTPFLKMIERHPCFPIEKAVKGMLPKNRLAKVMFKKLHVFESAEHTFKNVDLKPIEIA
jgi:large subunit ribosomal protein L13